MTEGALGSVPLAEEGVLPAGERLEIAVPLATGLSRAYLVHHGVCPVRYGKPNGPGDESALLVAVAPDGYLDALDDIAVAYQCAVAARPTPLAEVERLIEQLTARQDAIEVGAFGDSARAGSDPDEADTLADVRDLASQPPVIRYVNLLVREAFETGASDIHLEAARGGTLTARLRLDGVLTQGLIAAPSSPHAVISRIKLLAELDIAERRKPQDGRIRVRLESRELDLRVSTVPTLFGESVVLRLLDRGGRPVELGALGMSLDVFRAMVQLTERPHGMLLVTGPTGSGKTTTLYAGLSRRKIGAEKIITVEDPVEYELAGVAQVPVHRQAGVTMGSALRSILRQDPDVIMVGEMRDAETAEIAIQAAMTGHLVFSTLHTTDAIGAVPRLVDLGVADYLVATTLEGVLAQRLVRRTCDRCRIEYDAPPQHVAMLTRRPVGRVRLTRGVGCEACRGTGYRGRTGLFELLVLSDPIKDAIARGARRAELLALATDHGMVPLKADGWAKVEAGVTTVEEVLRVAAD
jgi:general secretion pathway protein E